MIIMRKKKKTKCNTNYEDKEENQIKNIGNFDNTISIHFPKKKNNIQKNGNYSYIS